MEKNSKKTFSSLKNIPLTYIHTHIYIYIYIHTYTNKHIYTHKHTHTHTHIYIYIYTHIHDPYIRREIDMCHMNLSDLSAMSRV